MSARRETHEEAQKFPAASTQSQARTRCTDPPPPCSASRYRICQHAHLNPKITNIIIIKEVQIEKI